VGKRSFESGLLQRKIRRDGSAGINPLLCHPNGSSMKIRLIILGAIASWAVMAGLAEPLPKADGKVSATTLPLDAKTAKVKFETATFGLG
jgi:hypothetical protein